MRVTEAYMNAIIFFVQRREACDNTLPFLAKFLEMFPIWTQSLGTRDRFTRNDRLQPLASLFGCMIRMAYFFKVVCL